MHPESFLASSRSRDTMSRSWPGHSVQRTRSTDPRNHCPAHRCKAVVTAAWHPTKRGIPWAKFQRDARFHQDGICRGEAGKIPRQLLNPAAGNGLKSIFLNKWALFFSSLERSQRCDYKTAVTKDKIKLWPSNIGLLLNFYTVFIGIHNSLLIYTCRSCV